MFYGILIETSHTRKIAHWLEIDLGKSGREFGRLIMKIILWIISTISILMGGVWILQGVNILPGSFMTGQIQWAFYGAIAILAGIGLFVFSSRRL